MFISFPAIVSQWVELDSLAVSSRNAACGDPRVESIAKAVAGVNRIFKEPVPVLLSLPQWFEVDALE